MKGQLPYLLFLHIMYIVWCTVCAVKMISEVQFEVMGLAIRQIAMLKAFLEKPVSGMDLQKCYSLVHTENFSVAILKYRSK